MPSVKRIVYFYGVQMNDGRQWRRGEVLRAIEALAGDDVYIALGDDQFAWAKVDRIPRAQQYGRLRFFRDRRSNLPGYAHQLSVAELPIPADAGLVEPTHIVLAPNGLIAAEYNHFGPKITTHFRDYLRTRLQYDLQIGTYVQGSIVEQLDRLDYINLVEATLLPTDGLDDELRNAGPIGDAAASLMEVDGGRRVNLKLSGDEASRSWTESAKQFVKHVAGIGQGDTTATLRVRGFDPASHSIEWIDVLSQKLVRRVDIDRPSTRSKALDDNDAYEHIEAAIEEALHTDLPRAALII